MNEAKAKIVELAKRLGIETKGKSEATLCKAIRLKRKEAAPHAATRLLEEKGGKEARALARSAVESKKAVYEEAKAAYEEALSSKRLAYEELQAVKAVRTAVNKAAPAYREKEKAKEKAEKATAKQAKRNAYIEMLKARLDKAIADSKVA